MFLGRSLNPLCTSVCSPDNNIAKLLAVMGDSCQELRTLSGAYIIGALVLWPPVLFLSSWWASDLCRLFPSSAWLQPIASSRERRSQGPSPLWMTSPTAARSPSSSHLCTAWLFWVGLAPGLRFCQPFLPLALHPGNGKSFLMLLVSEGSTVPCLSPGHQFHQIPLLLISRAVFVFLVVP